MPKMGIFWQALGSPAIRAGNWGKKSTSWPCKRTPMGGPLGFTSQIWLAAVRPVEGGVLRILEQKPDPKSLEIVPKYKARRNLY